jgi:glutathione S-transferase
MYLSFPAIVTILALALYIATFLNVGRLRGRFAVQAPAITGPPEFERALRIQQNTVEQLVWFLPAMWLFVLFVSPLWGGILGLVWIGGRAFYAISYTRDPATRGPSFAIAFFSALILLVGALVGAVAGLL